MFYKIGKNINIIYSYIIKSKFVPKKKSIASAIGQYLRVQIKYEELNSNAQLMQNNIINQPLYFLRNQPSS